MHKLCELALEGETRAAAAVDQPMTGLHRALFLETNPIPVKWALQRMGLLEEGIRLPLTWLTPGSRAPVENALRRAGVLERDAS